MKIRAHHLLCARNFQGKGYNPEFIKNFYNVVKRLDNQKLEIITSADIICKKCPHLKGGICKHKPDSEGKTKRLDLKVIKKSGIKKKRLYSLEEIKTMTKNLHTKDICTDCEWKSFCK